MGGFPKKLWRDDGREWSLAGFAIAAVCVLVAVALRSTVDGFLGIGRVPAAPFYPAVLFATLLGGLWPGVAAALLSLAFVWWAVIPPEYVWGIKPAAQMANFALYGTALSLVVWGSDHYRRIRSRMETLDSEAQSLARHSRDSQARHAAKAQELSTLLDIVPGGVLMADAQCKRILGNRAFYEALGIPYGVNASLTADQPELPEGTRVMRNGLEVSPDEHPMQAAGRSGQPVAGFDHDIVFPDGRAVTLLANTAPLFDETGAVRGVIGAYMDVTERKRAENALRESEARLSALVERLPIGVGLMDRNGKMLLSNSIMHRFVPDSIPLRDPARAGRWRGFDAEGRPVQPSQWPSARALRGETVAPGVEFLYTDDDGREIWTRVAAAPLLGEDGAVQGAIAMIQDIDQEKRAQVSVLEGEHRLRLALTAGRMGTWDWNFRTNEVHWSPQIESIHGLAPGTFDGSFAAFERDIHPDDRAAVLQQIAATVEEGRDHQIEYRVQLPDGGIRWVEGRGRISRDESGASIGMLGVCIDVTDRKQSEEKLKLVARELEHRTNNILARVKAIVRLARADSVPDLVQAIDRRIDALTRTHSLLSSNRWQGAELRRLIGDELAPYSSGADGRVQIVGPPFVLAVPGAESFGMVMHELTTNAAKYGALSRADGRLRIEWSQPKRNEFVLNWIESGVPLDGEPTRRGFGTRVITTIVEHQLSGTVEFGWGSDGLRCQIALPAEKLRQDL